MASNTRPFVGVDLGGGRLAGEVSWVAAGQARDGALLIERVHPVTHLAGGDGARDRALPALARWLAQQRGAVVAIDAPFSLPAAAVPEGDWFEFLARFATRFPEPEALAAVRATGRTGPAAVRATDRVRGLLSVPYSGPRGYCTWCNLHHLLGPLVGAKEAVALPMQSPDGRVPVLVETSVRAALRARCIAAPFRGQQDLALRSRRLVLERLARSDGVSFASQALSVAAIHHEQVEGIGAVVAATVAGRLARDPTRLLADIPESARIEGHVYV